MSLKTKLFNLELPRRRPSVALEGVEEPVPPPESASDVTIPTGGETSETTQEGKTNETVTDPATDAGGQGNEDGPDAAPSTQETLDNGDGSGDLLGESATGDEDAEDDDEVDPDGVIEYIDKDELRTTEVAEKEAVEQKLADDQDKVSESVDDAVEESKNLVAAVEALQDLITQKVGITQLMGRSMGSNLASARARLGFEEPWGAMSLEAFFNKVDGSPRSTNLQQAQITLEGYRSTLRNILESIIKAIQAAITYLVRMMRQRMFDLKEVMGNTRNLTKAVLAQRQKDREKDKILGAVSGKEYDKYVNLAFATRPGAAASLRILNEQPENYSAALKDVLTEVSVHQRYPNVFSKDFLQRVEDMFQAIVANKEDWDHNSRLTTTVVELFSKNSAMIKSVKDLWGMAPPPRVVPPYAGFYTTGLLGDAAFYNFIGKNIVGGDLAEEMEALTNWQFIRTTHASPEGISADGWLRFLPTDEIKAGSQMISQIGDELAKYEDTVSKMEFMEDELKGIAQRAAAHLGPMQNAEVFFDSNDAKHGWKGGLLTELVAMLNSIVTNLNSSMVEYQRYGQAVCIAWNYYLMAIYKKESELLAQHRLNSGASAESA